MGTTRGWVITSDFEANGYWGFQLRGAAPADIQIGAWEMLNLSSFQFEASDEVNVKCVEIGDGCESFTVQSDVNSF